MNGDVKMILALRHGTPVQMTASSGVHVDKAQIIVIVHRWRYVAQICMRAWADLISEFRLQIHRCLPVLHGGMAGVDIQTWVQDSLGDGLSFVCQYVRRSDTRVRPMRDKLRYGICHSIPAYGYSL